MDDSFSRGQGQDSGSGLSSRCALWLVDTTLANDLLPRHHPQRVRGGDAGTGWAVALLPEAIPESEFSQEIVKNLVCYSIPVAFGEQV